MAKDKRGRTAPVARWWGEATKERIKELGIDQKGLAKELGVSEARLSRDLGDNVNIDDARWLAQRLDLPRPVFIAESEFEARSIEHMLAERARVQQVKLQALDAAAAAIAAPIEGGRRYPEAPERPVGIGKRRVRAKHRQ